MVLGKVSLDPKSGSNSNADDREVAKGVLKRSSNVPYFSIHDGVAKE